MKRVEPVREKAKIAEVEKLLRQHNSNPIYGDLWVFLNQTAARVGDALKLKYTDFNHLEGNILNLKEQKAGKTRSIMLTAKALELVAQRRADNPRHVYLFEVDSNRAKGKPISRVTVSAKFKEAGDMLDLHIAAHSPRKNLGYHALKRGVSLPTLTKLYGHSSQAVTLVYCGIMDRDVENVYNGIDY
ncbi:TPA: tyrosine-type recombinase/integrase [Klebsiella quasipneumoniae]|nr:tyrosine-type recombinase/integrase [Klebsiella quasipneumoniae]HDT1622399.1 tyrosine-type recombinase/integrase [Klebsiella quasipneumoniae subsp. similipneumoniae]